MSLLLKSTISSAQYEAQLIKKNEKAPYTGILMPRDYASDLQNRAEKADFYKAELEVNKDCIPTMAMIPSETSQESFWIGTGVGATMALILGVMIFKH